MGFPEADSLPFSKFSAPSSVLVKISSPPQLALMLEASPIFPLGGSAWVFQGLIPPHFLSFLLPHKSLFKYSIPTVGTLVIF